MFCRNCGVSIPDDSHFCPKCGVKVFVHEPSPISSYKSSQTKIQSVRRTESHHGGDGRLLHYVAMLVGGLVVAGIGYTLWIRSTVNAYLGVKTSDYYAAFGRNAPDAMQWVAGIFGAIINIVGAICLYVAVCPIAQRFGAWRKQNKVIGTILAVVICLAVFVCFSLKTSATGQFGVWDYFIMAAIFGGMWKGARQKREGLAASQPKIEISKRTSSEFTKNAKGHNVDNQSWNNDYHLRVITVLVLFVVFVIGAAMFSANHRGEFDESSQGIRTIEQSTCGKFSGEDCGTQDSQTIRARKQSSRIDYCRMSERGFDDIIEERMGKEFVLANHDKKLVQAINNIEARISCMTRSYEKLEDMSYAELRAINQMNALLSFAGKCRALREALRKYGDTPDPNLINYKISDNKVQYATDVLMEYAMTAFSYDEFEGAKSFSQGNPSKMYKYFSDRARIISENGSVKPKLEVPASQLTFMEMASVLTGLSVSAFLGDGQALQEGLEKYGDASDPKLKGYRSYVQKYATDILIEYAYDAGLFGEHQYLVEEAKAASDGSPFKMFRIFASKARKAILRIDASDKTQETLRDF